jgi:Omp85 superfamily domain
MWLHYGNRSSDRLIKGTSLHAASTPRDAGEGPATLRPIRMAERETRLWHQVLGRIGGIADAVLIPAQGGRPQGGRLCRCGVAVGLSGSHLPGRNGESEFADLSDLRMQYDDSKIVRTSVGVGLTWQAPIGPLRFDYAVPINKGKYDVTIQVRRRDVVWIHRGVAMLIAGRDRLCNRGKATEAYIFQPGRRHRRRRPSGRHANSKAVFSGVLGLARLNS